MTNAARAQPGHMQELYMAVWPGMRVDEMRASGEYPVAPSEPVEGWQVIAIRFMFPQLHPVSATITGKAHKKDAPDRELGESLTPDEFKRAFHNRT